MTTRHYPTINTTLRCLTIAALGTLLLVAPTLAAEPEEGFTSIFNGKDLSGWEGMAGWWYVEEGAITSESTPEKPCKACNYLMWRGGTPGDFDLRLKYRIVGGNSGIQIRSREIPNFDTRGYQADIDAAGQWAGALFEHARGGIAMRGEKVVIDEDGKKTVTKVNDPAELMKVIKPNDWNDYRIVAKGNEIKLEINGREMSHAIDNQKDQAARSGIIALQVHPGPPMKIQFKDMRIKVMD